ncbi:ubl carboxyl-terminal hydrolase 18-like isoform X2 [Heterodontus francisci]|uniref:ubl carboxyl-terminal hydrolase 18-like isoform X2 n=1 Tax=Heterodontus francisci TaxID=7792 RepID=UPI00355B5DAC
MKLKVRAAAGKSEPEHRQSENQEPECKDRISGGGYPFECRTQKWKRNDQTSTVIILSSFLIGHLAVPQLECLGAGKNIRSTAEGMNEVTVRSMDNSKTDGNTAGYLAAEQLGGEARQTLPQSPWSYTCGRFKNGIVGLTNCGLTCCVNALLQSFYLTPEFTSILQRWNQRSEVAVPWNIPYEMCRLFDQMQTSVSGRVSVEEFLHCLTQNRVKVNIQHDAEELFLIIFNLLLDQLQNSRLAEEMKRLYEIKVEGFVECQCGKVSVIDSSMWSLPLPLQEMQNRGCFPLGFKLISVPGILNLHLNRFRAASSAGGFIRKIYSSVSFPEILNLDQLPLSEKTQKCGNGQECWFYQLYAVLTHAGLSGFGHYTAYVKSFTDSSWYHLDDACVSRVTWNDVMKTFGSHGSSWDETAYMLLYKRVEQERTTHCSARGQ